jgi:hypothetical protein
MSLVAFPLAIIGLVALMGPVIAGIFLAVRLSSRR